MAGAVILPPWQRNALVNRPETLYQHRIRQDTLNKHIWELILNVNEITQTHNTGTLLVAIVSTERLNNCVLILYRTDLLRIYHNL
jgi:hypothetical protein